MRSIRGSFFGEVCCCSPITFTLFPRLRAPDEGEVVARFRFSFGSGTYDPGAKSESESTSTHVNEPRGGE